jgi:4-hydroxythreonine-4-phosphate dehydrogenase
VDGGLAAHFVRFGVENFTNRLAITCNFLLEANKMISQSHSPRLNQGFPNKPIIAITSGEPAGIGPELMASIHATDFDAQLVVIGDENLIRARAATINLPIELQTYVPGCETPVGVMQIKHIPLNQPAIAGKLDVANAAYVLKTLDDACHGCLNGEYQAMVTAPIQKDIINRASIPFSGHTEYLAELCAAPKPVMMLATDTLRVALATTHLPLRDVADAINAQELESIIRIIDHDLRSRFGLDRPHIKVCGLNPHAGENGYLGREEIDIIIPLIHKMQQSGINISGPYPADTVFTLDSLKDADLVLAMYHDQGLPVLKHAGFNHAINTTLGLPIIRTSVDHGTALHLTETGQARPDSLFAAIRSAIAQAKAIALPR